MRRVVSALCIRANAQGKKEILLTENKEGIWTLPGGKLEEGESSRQCLVREIGEELPFAVLIIGDFFKCFTGITPISKEARRVRIYEASITGNLTPAAEIRSAWYWLPEELEIVPVSDITRHVIELAHKSGRLTP